MEDKTKLKAKSDSIIEAKKNTAGIFKHHQLNNGEPVEEIEYNFDVHMPLEEFFDVEIKLGEDVFKAHRAHLIQHSLYFHDLINERVSSFASLDLTSEKWINSAVLRLILQWVYTEQIPLCMSNFTAVSKTAKKLMMDGLLLACDRFLQQLCKQRGPLLVLRQATDKKIKKIQEYAKRYAQRNFQAVTKEQPFLDCDFLDAVIQLLSDDGLAVPNEKCVFDAATGWLKASWRTRRNHVSPIMRCIRFPLMSEQEFYECCQNGNRFIVEHPSTVQPFLKALLYRLSLKEGYEGRHENLKMVCTTRHYSFATDVFNEMPSLNTTKTRISNTIFSLDQVVSQATNIAADDKDLRRTQSAVV